MGAMRDGAEAELGSLTVHVSRAVLVPVMIALAGCSPSAVPLPTNSAAENFGPLTVCVSSYPLQYFVERIGGSHVRVHFPAPPGEDPAHWMPDADTVAAYQQADLVLLNGAGYEGWADRVALPAAICRNTSAAFFEEYIQEQGAVTHSHGPEGEHSHSETAFTTWLDPGLAIRQAEAVRDALVQLRPGQAAAFAGGFDSLRSDLEALDTRLATIAQRAGQTPLLFSHPVYQYLERRYALNGRSVHWEPDDPPTDAMWRELEALLAEHPAKWMIWEGPPAGETVARLERIGVRSIVFAPCGNRPEQGDYLDAMRRNADELERAAAP